MIECMKGSRDQGHRKLRSSKNTSVARFFLVGITMLIMSNSYAAGFYIQEVGTPHSVGTAGVANPTNTVGADASWSNPAGMVYLDKDELFSGLQLVIPSIEFDSDIASGGGGDGGNAGKATAVPSVFYVRKVSDRLSLGLSLAGVMGGGVDYGRDFVGRYSIIRAELGAVALSPSVGYKVNDRLSVGAGVSVIYTRLDQEIGLNPALIPTTSGGDGRVEIKKADDIGYQPFFSLNYQLSDDLLLGVVYRAEMDVELSGELKFSNVALPIGANKIDIDWDNPQWLEVGLRYRYSDKDSLYVSGGWQDWSVFSQNQLAISGGFLNPVIKIDRQWKDTWHAGMAYSHKTGNDSGFSAGFSYDSSPVDDENRTFDFPVDEIFKVSAAYGWKGSKKFDYAVGGTLYLVGDAPISSLSQGVSVSGEFDKNAILLLGGTLRYVF